MTEKRIIGICVIALLVAAMVGFIIGMGVGGHIGEKPYVAERTVIGTSLREVFDQKSKMASEERYRRLSCSTAAWLHDRPPVDNDWWQECLRGFAKDDS